MRGRKKKEKKKERGQTDWREGRKKRKKKEERGHPMRRTGSEKKEEPSRTGFEPARANPCDVVPYMDTFESHSLTTRTS